MQMHSARMWMAFTLAACGPAFAVTPDPLADGFAEPPDSAKCWAYWWWLDGYATREGITRDLEEMKRQGIAGVLIFDAGEGGPDAPKGPRFMSPEWRELFKHALHEADRLSIAVSVNLCSGWNAGGTWITPEHAAKTLVWSWLEVEGGGRIGRDLPRPKVWEKDYYRDIAVLAFPAKGRPAGAAGLKHWPVKAARVYLNMQLELLEEEDPGQPGERDCELRAIIDLTEKVDANGRLNWDAPAGEWTVLRMGYTLLGAMTSCPSPGTQAYESDFFSVPAFDVHWSETGARMIADAGPLAGKTLRYVHDDSYEVVGPAPERLQQNWTPKFRDEFRTRRGYDLLPYLPVLAGRIVDSREVSNRFLWDYRRTIADLFADSHYRRMHTLAVSHGVGTHPESGGPFWPCIDGLLNEGINDVPMGEFWKRVPEVPEGKIFWSDNYHICDTVRQAASAAHIYGKPVCQAEAFTSMGPNWEEDFYDLKDIGDKAFCAGLTRNMLCFYVHQGRQDAKPGFQWEAAGTHFDRHVSWWDQSHAWLRYLARCQFMLQQGRFVADLLYFYGEDAPNYVPAKSMMRPAMPRGYDCDTTNADVLLNRLSVGDGRLVLPDGMNYRLLVLPERRTMSPAVLRKIAELVQSGATIVGPRPLRAPGLGGFPECDAEVKRLADELWGDLNGSQTTERKVGAGRVIWGKSLADILSADRIPPDLKVHSLNPKADIDFIHRTTGAAEIYFLSNQANELVKTKCVFRVSGRQPEIWDAVTGRRWDATEFRRYDDRTLVPLEFAPRQSFFIVFRKPGEPPAVSAPNTPLLTEAGVLSGSWTVRFDPEWGGPAEVVFERLEDWSKRPEAGIRHYSGKAIYEKRFDLPESLHGSQKRLFLDLGRIRNVAEVRLNGKDLGVVWTAPWHVEITAAVQPEANRLEIGVVNLWPNRLIGDADLPLGQRLTVTNVKKFKKDSPLVESGLLGPVTLQQADR